MAGLLLRRKYTKDGFFQVGAEEKKNEVSISLENGAYLIPTRCLPHFFLVAGSYFIHSRIIRIASSRCVGGRVPMRDR